MTHHYKHPPNTAGLVLIGCLSVALAAVAAQSGIPKQWWAPGQGTSLPELSTYENDRGQVGVLNASGQLDTRGHPFFEPIGTNGRACVTCHQPTDAMSLSVRSIRERWAATGGSALPLTAARARTDQSGASLATQTSRWDAHRSGVHDRSRSRSQRLQQRSGLRSSKREPVDFRVPPSSPGGEHEVH